jgi:hypothetical protein
MTPAERLDALVAHGVMLYLSEGGALRARCEPCFAQVLDAAMPSIRQHRAALIAHLTAVTLRRSHGERSLRA